MRRAALAWRPQPLSTRPAARAGATRQTGVAWHEGAFWFPPTRVSRIHRCRHRTCAVQAPCRWLRFTRKNGWPRPPVLLPQRASMCFVSRPRSMSQVLRRRSSGSSSECAVRSDDRQVGEFEARVIGGAVGDLEATDVIALERLEAAFEALPRDDLALLLGSPQPGHEHLGSGEAFDHR